MTAPSAALVRAQVGDILEKAPDADIIGLRAEPRWDGPPSLMIDGHAVQVIACPSPLSLHVALRDRDLAADRASVDSRASANSRASADDQAPADNHASGADRAGVTPTSGVSSTADAAGPLVILTDLDDDEIGIEVRARLLKQRLIPLNRWQAVLGSFRATRLDPRLAEQQDLAEALVALAPPGGYAPVLSGYLDHDTAARALVAILFGAAVPDGTLGDLLGALCDVSTVGQVSQAPPPARGVALAWLRARFGPPVDLIAAAIERDRTADLPALSLVCGVLWSLDARSDDPAGTAAAAVRLEAAFGPDVDPAAALALADAGTALVGRSGGAFEAVTRRAERIIDDVHASDLIWASRLLPGGLESRLGRLGEALTAALRGSAPTAAALDRVARCAESVADHHESRRQPARAEAAAMAARLTRRLARPVSQDGAPATLHAAVDSYVTDGSFADWACAVIRNGEDHPVLGAAYGQLLDRIGTARRRDDARFAELLASWAPTGATSGSVVLIEDVLGRVVKPLIDADERVLLVVVDGLSFSVFQELLADLLSHGWAERGRQPAGERLAGIATFPTVTAASRTSLLCGSLRTGDAATEKAGFPVALGSKSKLWHKADLEASGGMAFTPQVADSLDARRGPPAVGVVINTVDDHLLKGQQIRVDWTVGAMGPLAAVLRAASGRTVVLTADHGHITTPTTARVVEGAGERWRPAEDGRPAHDDEVALRGPRVLAGDGTVIAPWTNDIRYSAGARHGYHGGASPMEVIVPVAVLVHDDHDVPGWVDVPARRPAWWDPATVPEVSEVRGEGRPKARTRPVPARPDPDVGQLFDPQPLDTRPAATPSTPSGSDWITRLQDTETYKAQAAQAVRRAPDATWVRAALTALISRGGTVPLTALADATGSSALRARGQVAGLASLLNVEGYLVVRLDEPTDSVVLDVALLRAQFGVDTP